MAYGKTRYEDCDEDKCNGKLIVQWNLSAEDTIGSPGVRYGEMPNIKW